MRPVSNNGMTT